MLLAVRTRHRRLFSPNFGTLNNVAVFVKTQSTIFLGSPHMALNAIGSVSIRWQSPVFQLFVFVIVLRRRPLMEQLEDTIGDAGR